MTAALWPIILGFLPASYNINFGNTFVHGNAVKTFFCISVGLWGGCVIGFVTEYFTSFSYQPTQEVARSTETGAATNIIYGLALGYKVRQRRCIIAKNALPPPPLLLLPPPSFLGTAQPSCVGR